MRGQGNYVIRAVPEGFRIWDARRRVWWGDRYRVAPERLAAELNSTRNPDRITLLLQQARPHLHHQRMVG